MPRDALTTRRLLAKIDREMDLYVVADRMRQAIYDESDFADSLEKRIIILENNERSRVTDSGVHKIIDGERTRREARLGKRIFWIVLSGLGALLLAAVGAVLERWLK